jgi:hypothetical protein
MPLTEIKLSDTDDNIILWAARIGDKLYGNAIVLPTDQVRLRILDLIRLDMERTLDEYGFLQPINVPDITD